MNDLPVLAELYDQNPEIPIDSRPNQSYCMDELADLDVLNGFALFAGPASGLAKEKPFGAIQRAKRQESVMKTINLIAAVLVIVGALNWGLVGVAKFNLVQALFGATILSAVVYTLVGIAGVYQLFNLAGASSVRSAKY